MKTIEDPEQYHHVTILLHPADKEHPIAIGFSNDADEVQCFVPLDLHTANKFGEMFCERYNEALRRVRGDT